MLGIDWTVWAGVGLVAAWKGLRWWKPSWAKQVKKVEGVARTALDTALILSAPLGWSGLKAKMVYLAKAEAELNARALPTNTRAIEVLERVWSEHLQEQTANDLIKGLASGKASNLLPPSMRRTGIEDE